MSGFGWRDALIIALYCSLSLAFFTLLFLVGSIVLLVAQWQLSFHIETSVGVALLMFPCSFYGFKWGAMLSSKVIDKFSRRSGH